MSLFQSIGIHGRCKTVSKAFAEQMTHSDSGDPSSLSHFSTQHILNDNKH